MTKKTVYLSGGMMKFGKENFEESNQWRQEVTNDLYGFRLECFNPNDHFSFIDDDIDKWSDREIMNFDLRNLLQSDLVFYNANDPDSKGSFGECIVAYTNQIPVLILNENNYELHPWLTACAEHVFSNMEEILNYIRVHYGE